jgi:uncharacterized protein (DUF169 family)
MNFDPNQIVQTLTASIRLALPPIAICFTDKVPAGIRNWTGRVPAGCRFWQEAATEVFATSPSDHDLCAIGTFTHNLETTEAHDADRRDALRVFADLSYVREQDIDLIPVLESRSSHVIYGPLATIPLAPDVVLLFGKAGQMLILSEASQQVEGGLPPAMGRPACAIVPQAKNTGRAALSLGCCGARISGRADGRCGALGDSWLQTGSLRGTYRSARESERRSGNLPPGAPQRRGGWQEPDDQGIVGSDGEPELG